MNKVKAQGMVDVSGKAVTQRRAIASGTITLSPMSFEILMTKGSPKGDVFEIARLAGIMAAKKTADILPLCHPLALEKVRITITPQKKQHALLVSADICCSGKTGVEMEALTAVSAACLCVYDMMKWAGQDICISDIQLMHKSGGSTGVYQR